MMREPQDSAGRAITVGDRVNWRGQIYTIKAFGGPVGRLGACAIEFEEPLHLEGEVPDEISVDLVQSIVESLDQRDGPPQLDTRTMPLITQLDEVLVQFRDLRDGRVNAEILSTCLGARRTMIWRSVAESEIIEGLPFTRYVKLGPALRHGAQLLRDLATQWEQEADRVDQETP